MREFARVGIYLGFAIGTTSPDNSTDITMTLQWVSWRLKSPASRPFIKPFVWTNIKENVKSRVTGPL